MFPSKLVRRAGIVSGVATGAFALAMAATPAYAIGTPALGVGSACPLPSLSSLIPSGLECVNGILVTITSQLPPLPTAAPTTSAPTSGPSPTPAPNPLGGLVSGVTGTVTKTVTGVTGTVTGTVGTVGTVTGAVTGGGSTIPGVPGTPSTGPTSVPTQGSSGAANGGTSTQAGATTTAAPTPKPQAPSDGSSLLGPAAAFLPGAGIGNFTDLGSLTPLADSIPSPLLAGPETKLAAVQAPLIAAGERASKQADDSLFSRFGNKALPGILVVLATAMVAAVGAGNLRAWQARLAAKRQG
ncbi:MAG TPA: hypothetical protein VHZ96_16990 [Frankiaceae bacterium]|jgi:hypothetical protein|nr:hypothetical protein [Frankiaceae bacterium]